MAGVTGVGRGDVSVVAVGEGGAVSVGAGVRIGEVWVVGVAVGASEGGTVNAGAGVRIGDVWVVGVAVGVGEGSAGRETTAFGPGLAG
jgi:hypothetical protein